jgi:hypothetical protein
MRGKTRRPWIESGLTDPESCASPVPACTSASGKYADLQVFHENFAIDLSAAYRCVLARLQ